MPRGERAARSRRPGRSVGYHALVVEHPQDRNSSVMPSALVPDVDFERPPVTEVALALAFRPLELTFQDLVTIWTDRYREAYPDLEEQPPFAMPIEPLDAPIGASLAFQVGLSLPSPRLWLLDGTRNHLVQLQKDYVAFNWRRLEGPGADYPRYTGMRESFRAVLDTLASHVDAQHRATIVPVQAEVTYINHIVAPSDRVPYRLNEVLGIAGDMSIEQIGQPESHRVGLAYRLGEPGRQFGRLHVTAEPGVRRSDGTAVLALTLTVRGAPEGATPTEAALDFMDTASNIALRAFVGLTTPSIQEHWGRRTR